jgi:flagellar biogenesis protein FliO
MINLISILSVIPTEPITSTSAVDFTWLFIKMLLVLAIVSIFALLILKYAVPHFGKTFHKGQYFTVLGRYVLEPKKSLYLVSIGKRYLVIGAADNGISLITDVSKEEVEEK